MKNILLLFTAVLPVLLLSQARHELKAGLLGPVVSDELHLAYEYLPHSRWGIELGMRYDWTSFFREESYGFDAIIFLKGGYRFPRPALRQTH